MVRGFRLLVALVLHFSLLVLGQVNVSTTPSQVMHGIGASGAWWPYDLFDFPESVREQAAALLFGSTSDLDVTGMGLTSYRYNVGGGGVFVGNPTDESGPTLFPLSFYSGTRDSRAPETFYVSPGVYNWSADAQGVYFLKKAAEYNVSVLTAFVNSAPPDFTSNNRSCGGTIVDAEIPAYAKYLADVIGHWKEEGIVFTHVSPMNEPDSAFNDGNVTLCGQEGMIVTPEQRAAVVNTLRTALDDAGLTSVDIMADESSSTGNFISEAPTWMPYAASSLAMASHHQYGFGDDAAVAQMGEVARNLTGKDTWFTEICCFGTANPNASVVDAGAALTYEQIYEPTILGGLQLGQLIYQSFTQALDAHFDFWTAFSSGIGCSPQGNTDCVTTANPNGWNDGLAYYDPDYATNGNFDLYTTKRFYVLKHFANFVWMGSTRFDVSGLPSDVVGLAFKVDQAQSTGLGDAHASLILMNLGSTIVNVDLGQVGLGTCIGGYVTSDTLDWQFGSVGSTALLPGLTITTFLYA
ncbi:glycoside hydrolase [Phellopilus nigrolimitatus]|nr:glycoside hydrolase [Phellopilus nigrolimitatus]